MLWYPSLQDEEKYMTQIYDIAIIGAGAVGSAIARELSRYELKIVLLEANSDVGMGTSKASTAIWHTGYDAVPGSLESELLKRSYPLMEAFMKEVGSPFELVGGLLIAWNEEQFHTLPKLLEKARWGECSSPGKGSCARSPFHWHARRRQSSMG